MGFDQSHVTVPSTLPPSGVSPPARRWSPMTVCFASASTEISTRRKGAPMKSKRRKSTRPLVTLVSAPQWLATSILAYGFSRTRNSRQRSTHHAPSRRSRLAGASSPFRASRKAPPALSSQSKSPVTEARRRSRRRRGAALRFTSKSKRVRKGSGLSGEIASAVRPRPRKPASAISPEARPTVP